MKYNVIRYPYGSDYSSNNGRRKGLMLGSVSADALEGGGIGSKI